uniref:RluA family pseudouridine synthase n=1 Tax=Flavobacterium sp. TaxID=239 RepID=UPI004049E1D9
MSALTKSALKKVLKKNFITVNGTIATTATLIKGGEHITLSIPEEIKPSKQLVFPLNVLLEDDYLAIIHKPAGILVSGNGFKTIANALQQNLQPSKLTDSTKPQPVHRLDYATTGALLVGKTSTSIRALNELFEDKKIKKTYYAITIGTMNQEGIITSEVDGKESKSSYTVIESVTSKRFGKLNLVKLNPFTGRRHQLRIHLASIGNPILGDKEYGKEPLILNGKGLYLHAYSLQFKHPFTKEQIHLEDKLPERFQKLFFIKSKK